MSVHLRTIMTILFASMLTLLTFFIGSVFTDRAGEEVRKEVGQSLAGHSFQLADKLDLFMAARFNEVQLISGLPAFRNQNIEEAQQLIDELQEKSPSFSWIGLTDAKGTVIGSSDDILKGASIAERPVFLEALEKPFIGDVHEAVLLSKLLPNPSSRPLQFVDISVPIINEKGVFHGVFATHLSWEWAEEVRQTLMESTDQQKKLELLIVSNRDRTILLGADHLVGQPLNTGLLKNLQSASNNWIETTWGDNKNYVTGYARGEGYSDFDGLGWHVIVRQPIEEAYAGINKLEIFMIIIGAVAIVLFSIIGWILANQIARPLRKITMAAREIGEGKIHEMPIIRGIKEVEGLSLSIRNMVLTITATQTALTKMESLAHQDTLTGLPNRIALYDKMKTTVLDSDKQWLIFFIDLDGFKQVNDQYGHLSGDNVLKVIAERLTSITSEEQFVYRLGGDEFVFLSTSTTKDPRQEGQKFMNKMILLIREPIQLEEVTVEVGCSVGAAIYPLDSDHPIETMHLADEALYVSKENGKNQGTFYTNRGKSHV
ncbi:diguanylate cyclase domain-containing protein [Paenisporosarcina sp. TG20]|uniref:diguanylate cyclase domain-containing protein n=1 Tax=Paenisporosarcina sp. TG20 TaxID=1211706 RepID=UPI0002D3C8D4|nr:diguanylate cyclase [Paenisporosarcina sp. TG20]